MVIVGSIVKKLVDAENWWCL